VVIEITGNVVCGSDFKGSCDCKETGSEKWLWVSDDTHSEGRKEESKPSHFSAVGQMAKEPATAVNLPQATLPVWLTSDKRRVSCWR